MYKQYFSHNFYITTNSLGPLVYIQKIGLIGAKLSELWLFY